MNKYPDLKMWGGASVPRQEARVGTIWGGALNLNVDFLIYVRKIWLIASVYDADL